MLGFCCHSVQSIQHVPEALGRSLLSWHFVALCCHKCLLDALQVFRVSHRLGGLSALLAVVLLLLQAAVHSCAACLASGTSRTTLRCRRSSSSGPRWLQRPRGASAPSRACSRRALALAPSGRRSAALPAALPTSASSHQFAAPSAGAWWQRGGVLLAGPCHRLHRVD